MPTIAERLREFYSRLGQLPRATSADEALEQICRTLDQVEDDLSGIPKKAPPPPPGTSDGRMYPPQDDSITRHPDGRITATTRRHRLEISADGGMVITRIRTGNEEFRK